MDAIINIIRGPIDAGVLYPQVWLAAALLMLKLFDWWSTNYIVGRKGGMETMSLAKWLIDKTGSVQGGLALDFVLVALCAWLVYPLPWFVFAGVVAWYGYWMVLQVGEVRKAQLKG